MKKLLLILALLLAPSLAYGQCTGVFPPNTLCGNLSGVAAPPSAFPSAGGVFGPGTTTVGHFATWNNTVGTLLADYNLLGGPNTFSGTNTFSGDMLLTGLPAGTQTKCLGLTSTNHIASIPFGCNQAGQSVVTSNYSIQTSDCGTTVQAGTGSTGQFTVTLPAPGGFADGCLVVIKNGDTGRGKILSGFPADAYYVLWPQLAITVQKVNSVWAIVNHPGYWTQSASAPFYVNTGTGSDTTNDCLNVASPCLTVSKVMTTVLQQVVFNGGDAVINVAGNITEQASCTSHVMGAHPKVQIIGDTATPHNVKWSPPNLAVGVLATSGCEVIVDGIWFDSAGTPCVYLDAIAGGTININANIDFGLLNASAGCGEHILVGAGGRVNALGNYTISGNMTYHALVVGPSVFQHVQSGLNMPSAITFSNFYNISGPGNVNYDQTVVCTGAGCGAASTGSQFTVNGGGNISRNSSVIPGATAGAITGGCVDTVCGANFTKVVPTTVASLPACNAAAAGTIGFVVDSNTAVWGAVVAGGGGQAVLVVCSGANFTVAGL